MAMHHMTEKYLKTWKIKQESINIHSLVQQIWIECLWKIKYSVVWKLHYLIYIELIHSAFQVYYSTFLPVYLLILESLILKLQLKILIYLLKNNYNL